MSELLLKNVCKMYDKKQYAVRDFSLKIEDGEFVIFVGPSGCGKSTTLRMIAGLEEITSGELWIDQQLSNYVEPKDRDLSMVFQNYALYPQMTIYDNMAFSLQIRKVPKDEIDKRVHWAASILGIEHLLKQRPGALSGGQKQRVAIGSAIMRKPKAFLMDEPLSNLDAKLRNQMRAEIIKLRERINTIFIYVTHDQTEAMTLGDRIVIMKDGVVQQIGTPQEVFNHPANLFVAGFIGTPQMNFFDASLLLTTEGQYAVEIGSVRVVLSDEKQENLRRNGVQPRKITLGVRPEHIVLTKGGENALHGKVDVSEMMGSAVHLHVKCGGKDAIIVVPTLNLSEKTLEGFNSGSEIAFTFSGNVAHMFDHESGVNLEGALQHH